MKITEEIERLNKLVQTTQAQVTKLTHLYEVYPDLEKREGRWEKVAYCSASVNSQVIDYESRYNCGCCSDSPYEVWPYAETPDGRIYSDPPFFYVGQKSYYGGPLPDKGWKELLQ